MTASCPSAAFIQKNLKHFTLLWEYLLGLINLVLVVTLPSGKYPTCLEVPGSQISRERRLLFLKAALRAPGADAAATEESENKRALMTVTKGAGCQLILSQLYAGRHAVRAAARV